MSLNPSTSTNSICESSNRCSASAISTSSEVEKRSSKNKENREKNEVTEKYIPGWVRVIADRQPSIYDVEALSLKVIVFNTPYTIHFTNLARPTRLLDRDSPKWNVQRASRRKWKSWALSLFLHRIYIDSSF